LSDSVVRAGAVAGALASIVGLGALVWPDSPGRLAASLENVGLDLNVGYSEFLSRQRTADAGTAVAGTRGDGSATEEGSGRAVAAARDLLKVLRGTRERELPGDTSEPLGVTPSFDLTL